MVPSVTYAPALRWSALAMALFALALVAPRLALLAALLVSIVWIGRRDDGAGTWGVLYVLLLLIVAVLALLVTGLALIHRLVSA